MRRLIYLENLKSQKGMTLIELIMIMLIIGLLAGISIPVWMSYMPTMRLNGAARNLQMALSLTRMKAVAKNRRVALQINTNQTYKLQYNDGTNWVDYTGNEQLMSPMDLSQQGVSIAPDNVFPAGDSGGKRVIFNSRGSCVDAANSLVKTGSQEIGNITLSNNKGKTRSITIATRTGLVNLN